MARSKSDNSVNKSEEIRKLLAENPKAKSREIVETLSARGITVAPSLVYMIKSKAKHKARRAKREKAMASFKASGMANPVDLIIKVKELAQQAGGVGHLKRLVDVLAE